MMSWRINCLPAAVVLLIGGCLMGGVCSKDYKGGKRGSAELLKGDKVKVSESLRQYMDRDGTNFKYDEVTVCELKNSELP
ncbi:hypothetical protein BOX15_Mlig029495g5 [Macrostomum lignano]|uniref:Uncharacterized protein n=1 Tax=Macrostomum lignano TaxID=282301 RepID=A0A267DK82_9PLAT|nr:hypothetical protein BOX15_Mlig029495g5 [Macrostomum lignano]